MIYLLSALACEPAASVTLPTEGEEETDSPTATPTPVETGVTVPDDSSDTATEPTDTDPTTPTVPVEVVDLASYTARCEQLLGEWPTFNCYDGVQVAVEVTGADFTVRQALGEADLEDGWKCDRPSHLQSCVPYGRIGTLTSANGSTYTFVCRSYSFPHPDGSLTPDGQLRVLFEDMGVIAQNPDSGDTCFWAIPIDGRHFDGVDIPKPGTPEDADFFGPGTAFWYSLPQIAGAACVSCHDNDPYIHTPWADQTGVVPSNPLVPYEVVARDVLIGMGGSTWSPAATLSHPDAAACLDCHRLGDRFTCGNPVLDATGRKPGGLAIADVYATQWPYDHWMDDFSTPDLLAAYPTEADWDYVFGEAAHQVTDCCNGIDPDGLCWTR